MWVILLHCFVPASRFARTPAGVHFLNLSMMLQFVANTGPGSTHRVAALDVIAVITSNPPPWHKTALSCQTFPHWLISLALFVAARAWAGVRSVTVSWRWGRVRGCTNQRPGHRLEDQSEAGTHARVETGSRQQLWPVIDSICPIGTPGISHPCLPKCDISNLILSRLQTENIALLFPAQPIPRQGPQWPSSGVRRES